MSARAIRKLREEREAAAALAAAMEEEEEEDDDDDDDADSEEEEDVRVNNDGASSKPKKASAFAMMNDDDSSSSSSSSSESEAEEDDTYNDKGPTTEKGENTLEAGNLVEEDATVVKPEENFDELLDEFKEQDDRIQSAAAAGKNDADDSDMQDSSKNCFQDLLAGMDTRELDVDHVMRTSLLSAEPAAAVEHHHQNNKNNKRRNRQTFLFGNPREMNLNNSAKPPHYVGGGIGMSSYDRDSSSRSSSEYEIPWPYSGLSADKNNDNDNTLQNSIIWNDRRRWFTFQYADSYEKDCQDFGRIQESGDMNALVMFVAHHPFVVEALITLGMMLYQVNQAQEGLTFLRRSLWVYESATLPSFSGRVSEYEASSLWMDYDRIENKTYFDALFQLARVNNIAGYVGFVFLLPNTRSIVSSCFY